MADKSSIEWTDAAWNPVVGCSIVSPGCTHCYAMGMAARIEAMTSALQAKGQAGAPHYAGTTKKVNGNTVWTGKLALAPEHIMLEPLAWRAPRRIFVNSMGDLFHEEVPDAWIDRVFAIMALSPTHTFQVLTKRARRMREYLTKPGVVRRVYELVCDLTIELQPRVVLIAPGANEAAAPAGPRIYLDQWPLPNVWLGVSAERQKEADERVPELLTTPAAVRFVSAEPLIGPIDFRHTDADSDRGYLNALSSSTGPNIDWIIVGGESGLNARPMHPDWARLIRDQCTAAGVAYFFKQWGAWLPGENLMLQRPVEDATWQDGETGRHSTCDDSRNTPEWRHFGTPGEPGAFALRLGKKHAGRLLDGVEHNGFPTAVE